MIYTKKELLQKGETDYSIRCKVQTKHLFVIEHGVYSDKPKAFVDEIYICKKYPNAILTGLSAFYIYDLTDHIPDKFYLVTVQHSFPIRRKEVHQSYQESNCFSIGLSQMKYENGLINIYDLERLLIELVRFKERYSPDIYYEVLNSFRKRKDELDFYKVNEYAKQFKNSEILIKKIKEII